MSESGSLRSSDAREQRPSLDVDDDVITALVRSAAQSVPGVARLGRGGARWMRRWDPAPVVTWVDDLGVHVRIWMVADGPASLPDLTRRVRSAVASTLEQQLGLPPADVTVVVDGLRA